VLTKNKIPVMGLREIADKALNSSLKLRPRFGLNPGNQRESLLITLLTGKPNRKVAKQRPPGRFRRNGPRGDGLRRPTGALKPRNSGDFREMSWEPAATETRWRRERDSNCWYHHLLGRRIRAASPFTDRRVMIASCVTRLTRAHHCSAGASIPCSGSQVVSIRFRATFVLDVPAEWSVPGLIELADTQLQDEPQAA